MSYKENLEAAIMSATPFTSVTTPEWERVLDDIVQVGYRNKFKVFVWSITKGIQLFEFDGEDITVEEAKAPGDPIPVYIEFIKELDDSLFVFKNLNYFMSRYDLVVEPLLNIRSVCEERGVTVVFMSASGKFPQELECFHIPFEFELPDDATIQAAITDIYRWAKNDYANEVEIETEFMSRLIEAARGLTLEEVKNITALGVVKNDKTFDQGIIRMIEEQKAKALGDTLTLYQVKDLPDVGGLEDLKHWLDERELAFTPEAKAFGLDRPKGAFIFGVSGTGKSLLAKAIAKKWDMQLLVLGNVFDKYVGESERKMEETLKRVEKMAPCVLLWDEIDKGVGSSKVSDSGTASRVLGKWLNWLQECTAPVFVVATANSIQNLPPELLRKGRFDELWFVDLPGIKDRAEILKIHLLRKNRNPEDFDLNKLAQGLEGFTGSEIEQVIKDGLYRAFAQHREITTELLLEITDEMVPLSHTMIDEIGEMRSWGNLRARRASRLGTNEATPEKRINAVASGRKARL